MKIRTALPVAAVAVAILGLGVFGNSAFADTAPRAVAPANSTTATSATASAEQLLASYGNTNKELELCMKGKGQTFNAAVTKSDVADAFSTIPSEALTEKLQAEIAARTAAAPEDPNEEVFESLSPIQQAAWADALNSCSAKIEDEAAGSAEAKVKISEWERAARNSSEVRTAASTYQRCMKIEGFTVDADPNLVPDVVAEAEHGANAAAIKLADQYDDAWHYCVKTWQGAYDQKLFN